MYTKHEAQKAEFVVYAYVKMQRCISVHCAQPTILESGFYNT